MLINEGFVPASRIAVLAEELTVARAAVERKQHRIAVDEAEDAETVRELTKELSEAKRSSNAIDLNNVFSYHAPSADDLKRYDALRSAARAFAEVIIANTPPSADQSTAIRKVREAVMTANAAVALKGKA